MSHTSRTSCRLFGWIRQWFLSGVTCGVVLFSGAVGATESTIPWQCTSYTYTGNSQEECIQNLKENAQQEKIEKLERQLKHQEIALYELNKKVDRRMRNNQRDAQAYAPASRYAPPAYGFAPTPLFGRPFIPQYGYGNPLGFGVGPLPFLPSIGIVIN